MRTEYPSHREQSTGDTAIRIASVGDSVRGSLADCVREQSTDKIRAYNRARTETPTGDFSIGAVMSARTKYRQARSEELAANKVPKTATANKVPTSAIQSSIAASVSELPTAPEPTADPSPTYFEVREAILTC